MQDCFHRDRESRVRLLSKTRQRDEHNFAKHDANLLSRLTERNLGGKRSMTGTRGLLWGSLVPSPSSAARLSLLAWSCKQNGKHVLQLFDIYCIVILHV